MNGRRALAACAALALVAASPSALASTLPSAWTRTAGGLEVRSVEAPGQDPPWVLLVRADPAHFAVDVVAAPSATLGVEAVAAAAGAEAAINGGFFDAQGRPIGWVVAGAREVSAPARRGWGAFVVDARGPRIVPAARMGGEGVLAAVQAGPRLVVDGAPNPALKAQSARRSFVGIDARGRVVLGTTGLFPSDARALARWLARDEAEGGAGLVAALNLDGGSSSQLWLRGLPSGGDLALPGVPVPNAIVVRRR